MDNKELNQVYELYYQPLFLYALSLCKNQEDAEDLVANTFVKALVSFESGNLKSWMYTVLKNEFFNNYKNRKHLISLEDFSFDWLSKTDDILEQLIQDEERKWLYQMIYQLPDKEREVMLLTIQMNYQDAEISRVMDLSIENIRVIRHRAKQKLVEKGRNYNERT